MTQLTSRDGTLLLERTWMNVATPKGTVLLLHGYGDHSGRYERDAADLNQAGWCVRAIDFRGHGKSGGKRGHILRFSEYLDDLDAALDAAKSSPAPLYIMAHSHGALVAMRFLLDRPTTAKGLIAASPYLKLALKPPAWQVALGKFVSSMLPSLAFPAGLKGADMTRDAALAADYDADPLNLKIARARWFTESTAAQDEVAARAHELTLPAFFQLAGADKVADSGFAREVFARLGGTDKKCEEYAGQYHELLNEPERAQTLTDVIAWLGR